MRKKGKGNLSFENSSFLPKKQKLFIRHDTDFCAKNREAQPLSGAWSTLVFVRRKQEVKGLLVEAAHVAHVRVRPSQGDTSSPQTAHSILCETECPRG